MATTQEPKLTIMDSTNSTPVTEWHLGVVKALTETDVLIINVWNNKGSNNPVSDLIDTTITTKNVNGGDTDEQLVVDKWVQVCVDSTAIAGTDGSKPFTAIGGAVSAPVAHQDASGDDLVNHIIKGTANDGTAANSRNNYSKISLKVVPPLNATAGSHSFKVRVQGYYV